MSSKIIFLICTIWISTFAYSQRYTECNPSGKASVSADTTAKYMAIKDYFTDSLSNSIGNFSGIIIIQIFIDKEGNPCCFGIQNNTSKMESKVIKAFIDKMPRWRPAVFNEMPINFMAVIWLEIIDGQLRVKYVNDK